MIKQKSLFFKIPSDVIRNVLIPYIEGFELLMLVYTCKYTFGALCKEILKEEEITELKSMKKILSKFLDNPLSMVKDRFSIIRPVVNRRLKKMNLDEAPNDFVVFRECCRHGWIKTAKHAFRGSFLNEENFTCLTAACYNNQVEIVRFLVQQGGHKPYYSKGKYLNPLIISIEQEYVELLDILIQEKDWSQEKDKNDFHLIRNNEYYLLRRAIHSKRMKSIAFFLYYLSLRPVLDIEVENEKAILKGLCDIKSRYVEFKVPITESKRQYNRHDYVYLWDETYENLVHVKMEKIDKEWVKVSCTCAWKSLNHGPPYKDWFEFLMRRPTKFDLVGDDDNNISYFQILKEIKKGLVFCKEL